MNSKCQSERLWQFQTPNSICLELFHEALLPIRLCKTYRMYRQPGLLRTSRNFATLQFKIFRKKKNIFFLLTSRLPLRHFQAFSKIWRSHVFREAHKQNFELVDETMIFQGHLNVFFFLGSFMASLCSSRWSHQKCRKTECVALKRSYQRRPMWALRSPFLARYRFLKWRLKFRIFYTMAMAAMNMVSAGGFSGVSFHLRRCPQGVASVLRKITPIFESRRSKLVYLTVFNYSTATCIIF